MLALGSGLPHRRQVLPLMVQDLQTGLPSTSRERVRLPQLSHGNRDSGWAGVTVLMASLTYFLGGIGKGVTFGPVRFSFGRISGAFRRTRGFFGFV